MIKHLDVRWRIYPEAYVVGELLKSSKEFRAFYQERRKRIVEELHWAHDPALPAGIDYRHSSTASGRGTAHYIRLRRIPALVEDACKVAHELEHAVLAAEGFPATGSRPPENLSSALNSMLADPIANGRLRTYGFDLRADS